jgi:peptidase E
MSGQGHIIAIGGGGFSLEPDNPLMDRYVLRQARCERPRVCFLCPGPDESQYAYRFFSAFAKLDCRPMHLSLFKPFTADIDSFIQTQDVIYVGGGNTRSMLAVWREWSLDRYLRQAWESGAVLAGCSAGALCWFEQGLTDSVPGQLNPLSCLGLLSGSCAPHYFDDQQRRPAYHRLIGEGRLQAGYAIEDGAALHFHGPSLNAIISSQPGRQCYRVTAEASQVREQPLPAILLRATE